MRTAVGFEGERPLIQSIITCDWESTGASETSAFHQLSAGKIWRPERSSSRATLSADDPVGGSLPRSTAGAVGVRGEMQAALIMSAPATSEMRRWEAIRMTEAPGARVGGLRMRLERPEWSISCKRI